MIPRLISGLEKLKRKHRFFDRFHTLVRRNLITSYFYNLAVHKKFVRFFPDMVIIDASTICNLHCITCPTGKGTSGLTKGFLELSNFKKLIDEIFPSIKFISLSHWGEIFLNPHIFEIISYAENKGVTVEADSNLNCFNENMAEKLIGSGMSYLNVSIDGASKKTYSTFRRGGDFNKVIRNIRLINTIKRKYHSKKPVLAWQFITFSHNEHEIKKAKVLAKKLGMEFRIKPNTVIHYAPVKNKKLRISSRELNAVCLQLWYNPFINWNGKMLGCCFNFDENKHFGNAFKEGFFNTFYGKKMNLARKFLDSSLKKPPKGIICSYCKPKIQARASTLD